MATHYKFVGVTKLNIDNIINAIGLDMRNNRIMPQKYLKHDDYMYDVYEILSIATILYERVYFKEAWELLTIISFMGLEKKDILLNQLINNVKQSLALEKTKYSLEYTLYEPIKYYIQEYIPNAIISNEEIIDNKHPDLFIRLNNQLCVGEIKPDTFTNSHVKQLKMYMDTYQVRIGYAFSKKLSGNLLDGMIFIEIDDSIKKRYYNDYINQLDN